MACRTSRAEGTVFATKKVTKEILSRSKRAVHPCPHSRNSAPCENRAKNGAELKSREQLPSLKPNDLDSAPRPPWHIPKSEFLTCRIWAAQYEDFSCFC